MNQLIGRQSKIATLKRCFESNRSEFLIVYGRRRIGKTFLVRNCFDDNFAFSHVGVRGLTTKEQIENFAESLKEYSNSSFAPSPKNWLEAFRMLRKILEEKDGKKIVFIDEMPWLDKGKSGFVAALEAFWNGWAANRKDIFLIACGSSTSWMVDKLIYNKGGLHNRITCHIYLRPFTLIETEEYLATRGCHWDRFQIAQCYMAMGGVPYYLSLIDTSTSLTQNIDRLYYSKNAVLRNEFYELYYSLFKNAEDYIEVIKALSNKREGMTRQELSKHIHKTGSGLTHLLQNLERSDFLLGYSKFGTKKNGVIYRLIDFYSLFYMRFIDGDRNQDSKWWEHNMNSSQVKSWQGFSFELLCMLHLPQIKQKLGIGGISTSTSTWRSDSPEHNYQIDMVIDRSDRIINLCEMKFSEGQYVINKDYETRLRERMSWFIAETKTRKATVITMVSTYGLLRNKHSWVVQNEVLLDDLFDKVR